MDSPRARVVRLLAWISAVTGFLLLVAHMSLETLMLELQLTYVVYGIAGVGVIAGAAGLAKRRAGGRRSVSVAGSGALLANVLLVVLTFLATSVVMTLPQVAFPYTRGDVLPEFEIEPRDETGRAVRLADLRGRPVVLVFHRGGWCLFCQAQLAGLNDRLDELGAEAEVLAISVDLPEVVRAWARSRDLGLHVLHDEGGRVAKQYGLTYLSSVHGDVPVPATIVLDAEGRIAFAQVASDVRDRPDSRAVLDAVRALP